MFLILSLTSAPYLGAAGDLNLLLRNYPQQQNEVSHVWLFLIKMYMTAQGFWSGNKTDCQRLW